MVNNRFALTIVRDEPVLFTAVWSDAVFMFWRATVDDALLDRVEQDLNRLKEEMTSDYVHLTVLAGDRRMPPTEMARQRLSQIIKERDPRIVAGATVLQSTGFAATVSRGVVTEINIAANRREQSHKTFDDAHGAIAWLAGSVGHDQRWIDRLTRHVSEQFARLGA